MRHFLLSVHTCLQAATAHCTSPTTSCTHLLFQPNHLRENCSSLLLFALGRLLFCETGSALLHAMEFPDLLITLTVGSASDSKTLKPIESPASLRKQRLLCAKFLLPSMNYVGSGSFGRSLLAAICSSGHTALRLFTTKFMHLLLRLNIPTVEGWLIPLLLNLTSDRSAKVVLEAVSVLEVDQ